MLVMLPSPGLRIDQEKDPVPPLAVKEAVPARESMVTRVWFKVTGLTTVLSVC